ncbi:copper transport protein [Micromonospora phaseoli]|uniref:Copper transport protein n=1 Tax=Micromonospora phaseoli TaxID=1144548 RepID=A0A1H6YYF9_9ACTN|nr:FixH family protein [Micromonospora phaseoli]PZW00498.1 copper transport protein [Micromonospora phaseoli]GIJ80941.1 transport integral membrane protein [Micromonospora phaseoli]SEJ46293.1 copper transport protein [Micromonospora phaseoli]
MSTGLAGLLGLVAAVVPAAPAAAHAVLLGTDPADGAVLATVPAEVTLTFNEPVTVRPGGVRLLDAAGDEVSADSRSVDTTVLLAVPPNLPDGTYIVTFRVISADSHPVSGGFSFAVGAPNTAAVPVPVSRPGPALDLLRQAAEAAAYLGLLVSAGLLVFLLVMLRTDAPVLRRRLLRLAGWSAGLTVLARLVLVPAVPAWQDGRHLAGLVDSSLWRAGLSSDEGLSSLLVVIGLGAALWATNRTWSPRSAETTADAEPTPASTARRTALTSVTFAGVALAWGAVALVGHTRTYGPTWLLVPADILHVTTAGVWLGGLAALPWVLTRSADLTAGAAARTVSAFSRTAAVLVALLGVAGLLLGWRILRSWEALWSTPYGLALLTKVGLTAVVLAVAAHNRFRLVPRIVAADRDDGPPKAWRLLRRTVRFEASLLVAVVAATGFLVTQSPVTDPAPRPVDTRDHPLVVEAPLGPGRALARFTPGTVGVNSMELELLDAAGQPVVPVDEPKLTVLLPAMDVGPLERTLAHTGPGRYEAVVDLPLAGSWVVQVSVRTSKYDSPVGRFTVDVR